MIGPLVQLYSKKLTFGNMDAFVSARPDHIGWQINLTKLDGAAREEAIADSTAIAKRLDAEGIVSVFLLHPSLDSLLIGTILEQVRPNIFLASAARSVAALKEIVRPRGTSLMVPVGIPVEPFALTAYDPVAEARSLAGIADWLTTDTITASDTVDRFGCSGQTSDWDLLMQVVATAGMPVIAAGGLRHDNVAALWGRCRPSGFDAHTAVCTSDGLPDAGLAKAFTEAVRLLD